MLLKIALTSSLISSATRSSFLSQILLRQHHVTSTKGSLRRIPTRSSVSSRRPTISGAYAISQSHTAGQLAPTRHSHFHSSSSKSSTSESYATESITYPTSWTSFSEIKIDCIELPPSKDRVNVTWSDKAYNPTPSSLSSSLTTSFPLIWLRDNCRCPECFSPDSKSRIIALKNLDVMCKLDTFSVSEDSKSINIKWRDCHVSNYPARWLRCNVFDDSELDPMDNIPHQLWDASTCRDRLTFYDFNDLLTDDRALYDILLELRVLGIAVIENTPLKKGQLHRLAERVGYLVPCNYGETFQVQSKVNPSTAAYTTGGLPLHTDISSSSFPPGIQMLHCIKQADLEGGSNILVDGFKIAHDLRKTSPDLYDVLTKHDIEFYDSGIDMVGEMYQKNSHRIFRLNNKNEVDRIIYSDHKRSAMSRMPVDDVIKTYEALVLLGDLMYDPQNVFEYKMKDGDILIMDNHRTLHGRKAFTMQPGSSRHLEGSYFEWDTVMSKLRILKKNLQGV